MRRHWLSVVLALSFVGVLVVGFSLPARADVSAYLPQVGAAKSPCAPGGGGQ